MGQPGFDARPRSHSFARGARDTGLRKLEFHHTLPHNLGPWHDAADGWDLSGSGVYLSPGLWPKKWAPSADAATAPAYQARRENRARARAPHPPRGTFRL